MATSYNIGIRHMLPVYPLLLSAAVLVLFRSLSVRAAAAVARGSRRRFSSSRPCASIPTSSRSSTRPPEGPRTARRGSTTRISTGGRTSNVSRGGSRRAERKGARRSRTSAAATCRTTRRRRPCSSRPGRRFRPGLWAVSSFLMCCGPETMAFHGDPAAAVGFQQLRREISARGTPVGRVGYSIVLYDLREKSP